MRGRGMSFGTLIWLIIGLVVAVNNNYAEGGFHSASKIINFLLATVLWLLVLLGVKFNVKA